MAHLEQFDGFEATDSCFQIFILYHKVAHQIVFHEIKEGSQQDYKNNITLKLHAPLFLFQIKTTFEEVLSRLIAEELIYILAGSSHGQPVR